jgi:hypothetical protein
MTFCITNMVSSTRVVTNSVANAEQQSGRRVGKTVSVCRVWTKERKFMKTISNAMLGLLLAVGSLYWEPIKAQSDERTLWVHYALDKTEYTLGEPIFLSLSLENYGPETQYFGSLIHFWRKNLMELIDDAGYRARWGGKEVELSFVRSAEDTTASGEKLGPGHRTGNCTMNLLNYFGRGEPPFDYYLIPGRYTLRGIGLRSDTVSFTVKKPASPEDSAAAAQLTFIADTRNTESNWQKEKFRLYSEFVTQFPNSALTPVALNTLFDLSTGLPTNEAAATYQRYARMMLTKFPESGFAYYALLRLDDHAVPADEKLALLDGLRKLRPRLKTANLQQKADELIGKLEK